MEHSCLKSRWFLVDFLHVILLLCMSPHLESAIISTSANESDHLALLDFKNHISQDPLQIMSSWNDSVHFCNWVGVTCDPFYQRVEILNLEAQRLVGSIPPSIGNFTFLTGLNLRNNSFHGEVPQEMGRFVRLRHLNLSFNSFDGRIPTNLSHCTELRALIISHNEFTGKIPDQLSSLSKLVVLYLGANNLTGSIPPWIGNLSSLYVLSLGHNNLQGSIPEELGRVSGLEFFQLYENSLSGMIPSSIYNISSIFSFSVTRNQLHGQLPPDVGLSLPNLEVFLGGMNHFTGPVPVSLSNASGLTDLDFAQNGLTGTIPGNLGSLAGLVRLNFDDNKLGNGEIGDLNFLSFLANCSGLEVLGLAGNRFGGELPSFIANLSTNLKNFTIGRNLLQGSIPIGIENLVNLALLGFEGNQFGGYVPDVIGKLQKLKGLHLNVNKFSGPIPSSLGNLTILTRLYMQENRFEGSIPPSFGDCQNLVVLYLGANNLTGSIPPWIGNLTSLHGLSLGQNNLQGSIPEELGRVSGLEIFELYENSLSGMIPSSIYNISSIFSFSVTRNQLHGQLPPDVGLSLPNLEAFLGGMNHFTGPVPVSLSNASGLMKLDFAQNGLTGTIPGNLGTLAGLVRLNFDENKLGNGEIGDLNFLSFLANCSGLEVLGLAGNRFGGELPSFIANLSTNLKIFTIGRNLLQGSIPIGIENLVNLALLGFEGNQFGGYVPDVIGKLQKLEGLHLNINKFSGPIPSSLGNLTILTRLFMQENRFEGSIPPSLGDCQNLLVLNLSSNNLNGSIPKQVIGLSSLSISLAIAHNSLTGSIPLEVSNLHNLVELDLSENKLSGEIPSTLGNCISLIYLRLEGNAFEGTIPQSLKTLRGIEKIDLSRNNLSGQIPEFLSKLLFLRYLNLSYNDFEGEVSREGIFTNASAISIAANDKLCGGVRELLLPACSTKKPRKILAPKVVIPVTTAVIFILILLGSFATFYMVRNSRMKHSTKPPSVEAQVMSYSELVKSTDGFSADNLIGSGSFGSVYKGILTGERKNVAIKVLNLQQRGAAKSFIDECNALRSIRHRNLLKIITACSSVDHQGNDFKALVFEFMSNGSLDQQLHPRDDEQYRFKKLSLIQRLNIAIDVASALDYLHRDCETPIVHCDLKSSNVLLDDDMVAHVGDFGLAKFLFESSNNPSNNLTVSAGLKGSIGYIPPEYGTGGQVSILGDIYSFGILLLEMFTGKRPTDDMFEDGLSIHKFTAMALPEHVMDIVDPSMLFEDDDDYDDKNEDGIEESAEIMDNEPQVDTRSKIEECLVSVMGIGLSCSATLPIKRMAMNVVVNKMRATRDSFLRVMNERRRRMR